MKKKASRSIRLILLLALIVPTSGWTVTKVAERFNIPIVIAQADKNSLEAIDTALSELNDSKDDFITKLEEAIEKPDVRTNFNSNKLYNKFATLHAAIDGFKQQNLSEYKEEQRTEIIQLLDAIKQNNTAVVNKILKPLQEGLGCDPRTDKCTNLETVQGNLNSLQGITLTVDGILGTGTIDTIEGFISIKIDDSQSNFGSLKNIKTAESLPQSNQDNQAGQDNQASQDNQTNQDNQATEQTDNNFNTISLLVALSLSIIALLSYIIKKSSSNLLNLLNKQINLLNEQIPSIVNRQIDLKLRLIKDELRKEIIDSLKVNERSDRTYFDVPAAPVEEKANYQSQRRDRNQNQASYRNENTAKSLYQAVSPPIPRLVQTYNRDPLSLWRNALEVGETETSFNNRQSGKNSTITLANRKRGIYAVIEERDNYFLIPSKHFRITEQNYKIIQGFFECREYQKDYSDRFYLVEPAKLFPMPDGKEWILEEKGILNFNPDYPVIKLRKQLEQANKEKEQFQSKLAEIDKERQQLKSQVTELTNRVNDQSNQKYSQYSNVKSSPVKEQPNGSMSDLLEQEYY